MLQSRASRLLPACAFAAVLLLVLALLLKLQNPVSLDDGLRHFAMGRMISERGIASASWSTWLPQSYFGTHVVDPWFLSDVLLAPLSSLGVTAALKLLCLLSVTLLLCSFGYVAKLWKLQSGALAALFVLLVFFEPNFLYRELAENT